MYVFKEYQPGKVATHVIPVLARLRQEYYYKFKASLSQHREFQTSLNYIVRPCVKENQKQKGTLHLSAHLHHVIFFCLRQHLAT